MKKNPTQWSAKSAQRAAEEGWQLARVVDENQPIDAFYLMVFDNESPKFNTRNSAEAHVVQQARKGSSLHIDALAVIRASRIEATRYRQ